MMKNEPPLFSLCTGCMGRLIHLKETLPLSLLHQDVEIVLVDYSCPQFSGDWAERTFPEEVRRGKIRIIRVKDRTMYSQSHAKNVAHVHARGQILVNADADNFIDGAYLNECRKLFTIELLDIVHCAPWSETASNGMFGRIAIRREAYHALGGYDENMEGWGGDDHDLINRAKKMGLITTTIPHHLFNVIEHGDDLRTQYMANQNKQQCAERNDKISKNNLSNNVLVANGYNIIGSVQPRLSNAPQSYVLDNDFKSIIIIIPYFGKWPEWIDIFLLSCSKNSTINWCLYTDCPIPGIIPPNVRIHLCSLVDYYSMICDRVQIRFQPESAYRLCDVRPMFGLIHADEIQGFDYYGYGDLDVIYGDIRAIYTDEVLSNDYISSHECIASGHLSLFRNIPLMHEAFKNIPDWRRKVETAEDIQWQDSLDEAGLTQLFHPRYKGGSDGLDHYRLNSHFCEQYTTPFKPEPWIERSNQHPDIWFWNDGKLTNHLDGDREFIYLHFMNFRNARYVADDFGPAPWKGRHNLVHFNARDHRVQRIRIDRMGFHEE